MALNSFKTLYHAVTEEDSITDNSLEDSGHERMIFVPGNIGLIRDTDGQVIEQTWGYSTKPYPLPERNLDDIRAFVDARLVENPDVKWGLLNLEAPHLPLIDFRGSVQDRNRTLNAVKDGVLIVRNLDQNIYVVIYLRNMYWRNFQLKNLNG